MSRYPMFAGYNAWCNERLYAAASTLSDADYRADRGAFFKSVHGTLNHLLVGDRIWMQRFTGEGELPAEASTPYCTMISRPCARRGAPRTRGSAEYIGGLRDDDFDRTIRYRTFSNPADIEQVLAPALDHFFNHQTHHRGQAHALLSSVIGNERTPSFDLIIYQRETGQGGLRKIG